MYIQFSKEQKDEILSRIQEFFSNEREENIGELAAENVLYFITNEIGSFYYNQALKDAQKAIDQRTMAMEEDLLSLKRPTD